jgi:uncharacterized membrane protein
MEQAAVLRWVGWAALGIELLAVALIVIAIAFASINHLFRLIFTRMQDDFRAGYDRYRRRIGEALLLGLEILVAADIVRTVTLDSTLRAMVDLALLVLVRIALGWSLVVELEGRWPWQPPREVADG